MRGEEGKGDAKAGGILDAEMLVQGYSQREVLFTSFSNIPNKWRLPVGR